MTGARKPETHPGMLWFQPVTHGTFTRFIRWRPPCACSESGSNYNRQETLLRPSGCVENSEPKSHGGHFSISDCQTRKQVYVYVRKLFSPGKATGQNWFKRLLPNLPKLKGLDTGEVPGASPSPRMRLHPKPEGYKAPGLIPKGERQPFPELRPHVL